MNRSRIFGCIFDGKSLHCCIITLEVGKWVSTAIWYVRGRVSGLWSSLEYTLAVESNRLCISLSLFLCLFYMLNILYSLCTFEF